MTTRCSRYLLLQVAAAALLFSVGELHAQTKARTDRDCWLNDKMEACNRTIASGKYKTQELGRLYRARAALFLKSGNKKKAIDDLNAAIKAIPSDHTAYVRLSEIKEKDKDIDGAIAILTNAIASGQLQERSLAEIYEARAKVLLEKKERQRAIDDIIAATKVQPKRGALYQKLADLYEEDGDTNRALANFSRAIELKKDDTEPLYKRASLYRRKGDIDLAIADYDRAIKIDPEDADLFNTRGTAYAEKGDLESAIEDFSQAILRDNEFPTAHLNRGDAFRQDGDLDRAIEDYDKALGMKADNLQVLIRRAITYRARGDYDRALADLNRIYGASNSERFLSGITELLNILYERGVTYALKRDFQKSLADLDEVIAKKPDHLMAFASRGIVYAAINQPERAIADYSEAIRLDPENAERYVMRAWQSFRMVRPRIALIDAEIAIRLDPDLATAYETRAHIREALGDYALAQADRRAASAARTRLEKLQSEELATIMKGREGRRQGQVQAETMVETSKTSETSATSSSPDAPVVSWVATMKRFKVPGAAPHFFAGALCDGCDVAGIYCKQPLQSVSGLKGRKVVVTGNDRDFGKQVSSTGASIVFMPNGEIGPGLESGLVDCAVGRLNVAKRGNVEPAVAPAPRCDGIEVRVGQANSMQCVRPGSGQRFRDCATCPEMVIAPAGDFMMGSTPDEIEAASKERPANAKFFKWEAPRRKVSIARPFAVGRTHITRGEFAAFVTATDHKTDGSCVSFDGKTWKFDAAITWRSPGFEQTDAHPVVCVNWHDATAYAAWLSQTTGKSYRLMSEAEAEYVTRATTHATKQPRFFFGEDYKDLCPHVNGVDRTAAAKIPLYLKNMAPCDDGFVYTAPVASLKANPWGLHDVHGNASSWTADCFVDSYNDAPSDGSARTTVDCPIRVYRGGSWSSFPIHLRSAFRPRALAVDAASHIGFRLARTLSPLKTRADGTPSTGSSPQDGPLAEWVRSMKAEKVPDAAPHFLVAALCSNAGCADTAFYCRVPIASVADLKGKKVGIASNSVLSSQLHSVGAAVIPYRATRNVAWDLIAKQFDCAAFQK